MLSISPQFLYDFQIPDATNALALLSGIFFVVIIVSLVLLIPYIFFLLTLQRTLQAVSPANRKMEPSMVWLMLIPVFHWVWQFFVVKAIADSLENEFMSRGLPTEKQPTYNLGLTYAILGCCTIVPVLGIFSALAALICGIIYWVKVAEYKNKLNVEKLQVVG